MSELLTFKEDQLQLIEKMLLSKDKESVELALGMISSFDYNNKEELDKLSNFVYDFISNLPLIYDPTNFEPKYKSLRSELIYIIEKLKYGA